MSPHKVFRQLSALLFSTLVAASCTEGPEFEDSYASEAWTPTTLETLEWSGTLADLEAGRQMGPPGYDASLDLSKQRCLEVDVSVSHTKPFELRDVSPEPATIKYIDSKETLAKELGMTLGLEAKSVAQPIAGDGKFGLAKKFDENSNDMVFLLKTTRAYTVMNEMELRFTDEARGFLEGTGAWRSGGSSSNRDAAKKFIGECGTNYVEGLRMEAGIYVLVRYHADEAIDSTTLNLNARAEADVGGLASVKPNFGLDKSETSTNSNFSMEVEVHAYGFEFNANLAQIAAQRDQAKILEDIASLEEQMNTSIRRDRCMDDYGGPRCDGTESRGFLDNSRSADVAEVYLGNYFKNESFPGVTPIINELAHDASDVMETCLAVYNDMANRFHAGVSRMEEDPHHYNYNHLDDRKVVYNYNLADIRDAASQQRNAFDPAKLGSHSHAIQEIMAQCHDNAQDGVYDYCAELAQVIKPGSSAAGSSAYRTHLEAVQGAKPLVPLLYDVVDRVKTFTGAEESCGYTQQSPMYYPMSPYGAAYYPYGGFFRRSERQWRLPTAYEVDRLAAVFLENQDIPKIYDEPFSEGWESHKTLWFQDEEMCPHSDHGARGAGMVEIQASGEQTVACMVYTEWGSLLWKGNSLDHAKASTLCVPDLGPYPEKYMSSLL